MLEEPTGKPMILGPKTPEKRPSEEHIEPKRKAKASPPSTKALTIYNAPEEPKQIENVSNPIPASSSTARSQK
jgi:hypothetical protein